MTKIEVQYLGVVYQVLCLSAQIQWRVLHCKCRRMQSGNMLYETVGHGGHPLILNDVPQLKYIIGYYMYSSAIGFFLVG